MNKLSSLICDFDHIKLNDDNPVSKWYSLPLEISDIILLFMGDIGI